MSKLRPLLPPRKIVYLPRILSTKPAPPTVQPSRIQRTQSGRDSSGGSPRETKQRD